MKFTSQLAVLCSCGAWPAIGQVIESWESKGGVGPVLEKTAVPRSLPATKRATANRDYLLAKGYTLRA
jgi:hypothetical protein